MPVSRAAKRAAMSAAICAWTRDQAASAALSGAESPIVGGIGSGRVTNRSAKPRHEAASSSVPGACVEPRRPLTAAKSAANRSNAALASWSPGIPLSVAPTPTEPSSDRHCSNQASAVPFGFT